MTMSVVALAMCTFVDAYDPETNSIHCTAKQVGRNTP
jgi:hypothetical protein